MLLLDIVSSSTAAPDLGLLITEAIAAAGSKSWIALAAVIGLIVYQIVGALGFLDKLPEAFRSPVKMLASLFGAFRKPKSPK